MPEKISGADGNRTRPRTQLRFLSPGAVLSVTFWRDRVGETNHLFGFLLYRPPGLLTPVGTRGGDYVY